MPRSLRLLLQFAICFFFFFFIGRDSVTSYVRPLSLLYACKFYSSVRKWILYIRDNEFFPFLYTRQRWLTVNKWIEICVWKIPLVTFMWKDLLSVRWGAKMKSGRLYVYVWTIRDARQCRTFASRGEKLRFRGGMRGRKRQSIFYHVISDDKSERESTRVGLRRQRPNWEYGKAGLVYFYAFHILQILAASD